MVWSMDTTPTSDLKGVANDQICKVWVISKKHAIALQQITKVVGQSQTGEMEYWGKKFLDNPNHTMLHTEYKT